MSVHPLPDPDERGVWPGPFPDPCPACEGRGGDPVEGRACGPCAGTGARTTGGAA